MTRRRLRIGIDIGGTLTDRVLLDEAERRIRLHKTLTTPDDPSIGAPTLLSELIEAEGVALADIAEIVPGTTPVTNATIERRGAPLGLITTQGMRNVIELRTEQRYDIHDLFLRVLAGGRTGAAAEGKGRPADSVETRGAGRTVTLASTEEVIEIQIVGGSGYGNRCCRATDLIETHLRKGYVALNGALRDDGYALRLKEVGASHADKPHIMEKI